ncbi:MAG: hypothetical protein WD689_05110 [Gaiellaceae bacterium]
MAAPAGAVAACRIIDLRADATWQLNGALREIYAPVWTAALAELPRDQGLSAPLFISVSPAFASARRRLLIIGKQTQLWPPRSELSLVADHDLDDLLLAYRAFAFGSDRSGAPFWSAAHEVRRAIDPFSDRTAMAWSIHRSGIR